MRPGIKRDLYRTRQHTELHRLLETTRRQSWLARWFQSMLWPNAPQPRTFSSSSPAPRPAAPKVAARGDASGADAGPFFLLS